MSNTVGLVLVAILAAVAVYIAVLGSRETRAYHSANFTVEYHHLSYTCNNYKGRLSCYQNGPSFYTGLPVTFCEKVCEVKLDDD